MPEPEDARVPTRLVVCVDGTWVGPDGVRPGSENNLSTIFRIWCCIKEGEVVDSAGKKWQQARVYIRGIDNAGTWYGKLLSGVLGDGIEQQIKDVYKTCCERASHPEDEVFFFGFSRGAFVVRAVASLLAYMKIPGSIEADSFDKVYKQLLDIYKDVRSGSEKRRGAIYEYMSSAKPPPKLQYIGVVDTVKAFADDELYDIGLHPAQHHCRQALAFNETRVAFMPELWSVTKDTAEYELRAQSNLYSVIEAWFLGSHGDLGGGDSQDGIALYPAQWLLAEAEYLGLVLDFNPVTYTSTVFQDQSIVQSPLELIFPMSKIPEMEEECTMKIELQNGISVSLWDMRSVHTQQGFSLNINHHTKRWLYQIAEREIFLEDQLIGYHTKDPIGVIIHPSAYMIYDQNPFVISQSKRWSVLEQFSKFRQQALPDAQFASWSQVPAIGAQEDAKFRVLVCGDAGVGKSTLINMIFGVSDVTQESQIEHGIHDINEAFSPEGAKFVVHDSCGFQAGQQEEIEKVKSFLKARSSSPELTERLHAILYCVSSTRLRITEAADEVFFQCVKHIDADTPVIVVSTRIDEVEALSSDRVEKEFMLEHKKTSRRHLSADDWDEIERRTNSAIEITKQKVTSGLSSLGHKFVGPVFTSKDDKASVLVVVSAVMDSLTNDRIRTMFISAQMCSLQPKIDAAIANSTRLYGHAVRTALVPIAFAGLVATTTVTGLIIKDILNIFHFSEHNGSVASHMISTLLVGNYESNGIYVAGNVLNIAATSAFGTGVGALAGVALGVGLYGLKLVAVPQFGRLLLMCTVDTILIMEKVFWQCNGRVPTAADIQEACTSYEATINEVHVDIKNVLPVWDVWDAFRVQNLAKELGRVVDKHRLHKDASGEPLPLQSTELETENIPDISESTRLLQEASIGEASKYGT